MIKEQILISGKSLPYCMLENSFQNTITFIKDLKLIKNSKLVIFNNYKSEDKKNETYKII